MKKDPKPRKTTRIRLDVNEAEHVHLRKAGARAGLPMSKYALKLVREDMQRNPTTEPKR